MSGEVPKGWLSGRIADLVAEVTERIDPQAVADPDTPYIGLEDIGQGTGTIISVGRANEATSQKSGFLAGDILFGKLRPNLKKVARPDFDGICSTDVVVFRAKAKVDPDFAFKVLSSDPVIAHAVAQAAGTKMPRAHARSVLNFETVFPPLDEQRRIAEVLRSVDELLTSHRASISAARSMRQAVLDAMLREATEAADTHLQPLEVFAEIRTGAAKNGNREGEKVVLPYLRVANVQDGWIDLTEIKTIEVDPSSISRYSLKKGDVLLTEGGDFDKLGRGGVWSGEIDPCLHQNHVFAVRPDREQLLSEFLALVTQSYLGRAYFLSCAKRTTNLASINSSQLKKLPVPSLPLRRQQEIVSKIGSIDSFIGIQQEEEFRLRRLRSVVGDDLLSGRVRVPA